jgi:hypothetical protein
MGSCEMINCLTRKKGDKNPFAEIFMGIFDSLRNHV